VGIPTEPDARQLLMPYDSEVTLAAGILRHSGLISYIRGKVNTLERKALEALACECYRIGTNEAPLRLRQIEK